MFDRLINYNLIPILLLLNLREFQLQDFSVITLNTEILINAININFRIDINIFDRAFLQCHD